MLLNSFRLYLDFGFILFFQEIGMDFNGIINKE
jgi:hypothetical protein